MKKAEFQVTGDARKKLVKVIEEAAGEKAKFKGVPSMAYEIGAYTVTRTGTLEFADELAETELTKTIFQALAENGFTVATDAEEEEQNEPDGDSLIISIPMTGHTGVSLRNLVSMIYSRGRLLSKATGGNFSCPEGLVDYLKDAACVLDTERVIKTVAEYEAHTGEGLKGLTFSEDRVSFTGFPFTQDPDTMKAFDQLACQMSKVAREQKRTLAREVDETNERYIFRIWLVRLGMDGEEFKTARKVLLAPLSGSAAFKNSEMEQRWQTRQKARREAAREAKKAEQEVKTDEISE